MLCIQDESIIFVFGMQCTSEDTAIRITIDDIKLAGVAATRTRHAIDASMFCDALSCLITYGESSASCDKIVSAGGVSTIVELLRCYEDEEEVVNNACEALNYLAKYGSTTVKQQLKEDAGVISALQSASARSVPVAWKEVDWASSALAGLGVEGYEVA